MKVLMVTGGAGFIGSAVVRQAVTSGEWFVLNVDKLTYAGNLESLASIEKNENYVFSQTDICDAQAIRKLISEYKPTKIMHLAAESHVDRSIDGPGEFIQTNIVGTYTLLEAARDYYNELSDGKNNFMFHHVSTDEVYGSLGEEGLFTESTSYKPNSPYSASKASSDHLVRAWYKTYDLPTLITNCSNNYGPYQYPEKLIPLVINKAVAGEPLPVYGKGDNVRDWLYVEDHADALLKVITKGDAGEVYNVGGHNEIKNLDVVEQICGLLDELSPRADGVQYKNQITFVKDRPGHDQRYAIDASKIAKNLGWTPKQTFETGIRETINWYLNNKDWCSRALESYSGQRLGLGG